MGDIWSGDIVLPDNTAIKDVNLASQNVASSPALPATPFRFLTIVDTARIPLYLAAGLSLDVWTTNEATEEWFASLLLSKADAADASGNSAVKEWWACARAQSPIGILVRLDGENTRSIGPRVTEILFYGTIAAPAQGALPTPPSSSPDLPYARPEQLPEVKVHALPLSSDLLHQDALSDVPPLSPGLSACDAHPEVESRFLPPAQAPQSAPDSPKRKRDIFDEASLARKNARGKGGEGVSAAAARAQESQRAFGHRKSLSIDTKAVPFPESRPNSAHSALARPPSRQLSRSPSLSSDIRPLSRKGPSDSHSKRSTLSQVATIPLHPEEPTIETRNKEALSRVVMAAMRMHGLQQRKKNKSRRNSVAPGIEIEHLSEEVAAEEAAKDEEYKMIYHQTYKGASIALRKHIATQHLYSQPDRLRHVVEKLLAIFCTDPLTQPLPTQKSIDPLATPGSNNKLGVPGSTHSHASPFDLPSGARMNAVKSAEGHVHTGSPVRKKAKDGTKRLYESI
ncbi:hypothetical protein K458DRAFT_384675 [Lentithecium fluviatile CBS 122367]|uniref:Sld7 C-terminal domain-containing protein n=1 Tax=Lentithecium fluviatile CBS 122367 TaxID=1168545 RepID=A0A6G1JED7_9PLEO|nr:hypothetical protein K458DRAFT_384675 [Lentithecium fluviatile CBS 122367]